MTVYRAGTRRGIQSAPNMRLKLTGLLLKESAVPSPDRLQLQRRVPCIRGSCARSLSAIR